MERFVHLKNIDAKFYASDYYDVNVNKHGVECGTSSRFRENKGWINKIDPVGWFQWYFRYSLVLGTWVMICQKKICIILAWLA